MEEIGNLIPIPGYPGYCVTSDMIVIDTIWNYCLLEKTTGEYNWYYFERIGKSVHTHVIVARVAVPTNSYRLHVNHIDGNKRNNNPSNLEWVTPSGNLLHAFITNLRTDNYVLTVYDSVTGFYEDFYSLNETARKLGVNPVRISKYLISKRQALFDQRYVIGRSHDCFPELIHWAKSKYRNGTAKRVKVTSNGKCIVYESLGTVAKMLGITVGAVHYYLKFPNTEFDGKSYEYLAGETVGPVVKIKTTRPWLRRLPSRVRVVDELTKEARVWESLEEFANSVGQKKSTVQKAVYLKKKWSHYEIEYI